MTGDELEFSILTPAAPLPFAQMLAIYQEAILVSEQKSPPELAAMVTDPRYRILLACAAGRVVGFAIAFFPQGGRFWLLEYMAVERAARSLGYGERIFAAAERLAAEMAVGSHCLLEVDQPVAPFAPDSEIERRLRFYRRLGCRSIAGLDYILPLDAAGPPPPMWLLVHGLEGHDTVPKADVAAWLATIYVEVYGQKSDDPRLTEMLSYADRMHALRLEPLI